MRDYVKGTGDNVNPLKMPLGDVRIAGHRGHSVDTPENTFAAFKKARELGGHGVTCETDLRITKDGELVLIHDETVDRTTSGFGLVEALTLKEIAGLDAGSWNHGVFSSERIPLLKDALEFAKEFEIVFQLELKHYDRDHVIIPKLASLIEDLNCAAYLQFSSFDFVQLQQLKRIIPEVPTVGLSHSRLIDPAAVAREACVDAINLEIYHFPSGESQQLHDAGFAVFLHVPRPERLAPLKLYGIDVEAQVINWLRDGQLDQIISDDVAQVARLKDEAYAI